MESYVGETVLVSLRDPPGTQVRGLVSGIGGQQLFLRDVTWLPSGLRMEIFVVDGPGNLLDLEILAPADYDAPSLVVPVQPDPDPAILSYVKPPKKDINATPSVPSKPSDASNNFTSHVGQSSNPIPTAPSTAEDLAQPTVQQKAGHTSATLTGPFEDLTINDQYKVGAGPLNGDAGAQLQDETQTRKNRRKGKKNHNKDQSVEFPGEVTSGSKPQQMEPDQIANTPAKRGRKPRGNGWRETPLLEEATPPKSQLLHPQDGPNPPQLSRRQLNKVQRSKTKVSGWATEEATDIQEMGDFDFSGNLSKFDKRGVFDQLKQEDTTADEDRLVSFNRLPPRLGTAGGKNLHHTENVLSPKAESRGAWSNGDSEADGSQAKISSGRSSRRDLSRASIRKQPSRKGSAVAADQNMTASGSLPESKVRTRWASRGPSGATKTQSEISSSRDTAKAGLPTSAQSKPCFQIKSSGTFCPCLTPLQMLELEQVAISELGLTEDLITENAARSIADTAINAIEPKKRGSESSSADNIVVMAGNTKSGARAIAAARQLLNHGATITVVLLATERKSELLDAVQRQLYLYKTCGGGVTQPDRVGADSTFKRSHGDPDIAIDALLGMHMSFEDLGTQEQERYFGLVQWANNCRYMIAVDVPSGLDASSGSSMVVHGTDLLCYPNIVLSLGAPKNGLLIWYKNEVLGQTRVHMFVADIGISNKAWKKFGTRSKHGIEFGPEWVAALRYSE